MSVLQSEFAISLITIFYLKTNFILHPYFFAYKKKHIVFFGETYKRKRHRLILGLKTDGRITRYCDRIRKTVKLTIAE